MLIRVKYNGPLLDNKTESFLIAEKEGNFFVAMEVESPLHKKTIGVRCNSGKEFLEKLNEMDDNYEYIDVSNNHIDILYYINPFDNKLYVNATGVDNNDVWQVDREVIKQ